MDAPHWIFEPADSELAGLQRPAADRVRLLLAAALLRRADGTAGHAPGLVLELAGLQRLDGQLLPGRLREGRLWAGGAWRQAWPVPGCSIGAAAAPLQLELTDAWGDRLLLQALRLDATFSGGSIAWRPWLHC